MTAIPQLGEYRLTTAEIIYRMPDHPDLLQSFIWQKLDLAPDFPELRRFLEFLDRNVKATLLMSVDTSLHVLSSLGRNTLKSQPQK